MVQSETFVLQGIHVTNQQGWSVDLEGHSILAVSLVLSGLKVQHEKPVKQFFLCHCIISVGKQIRDRLNR